MIKGVQNWRDIVLIFNEAVRNKEDVQDITLAFQDVVNFLARAR